MNAICKLEIHLDQMRECFAERDDVAQTEQNRDGLQAHLQKRREKASPFSSVRCEHADSRCRGLVVYFRPRGSLAGSAQRSIDLLSICASRVLMGAAVSCS